MFTREFLQKYPRFAVSESIPLTMLPPRMKPKPLSEVIYDDDEADGKQTVKKKPPESVEALMFAQAAIEPLVWFEVKVGDVVVPIVDATPSDYLQLEELVKEHILDQEPLCRAMRITEDAVGVHDLMNLLHFFMDSSTSLVAKDPVNNVPVGLLVGKVNDVEECTEKAQEKTVLRSKRVQTMLCLINFMIKTVNMHDRYNCRMYFRIVLIAIHTRWLRKGIEKALITGALRMCNVMRITKCGGNFTMYKDQYYFKQFGAKTELDVFYSEWRTDRGLRIFRGTGKTEPKISFMSLTVPDFEPSSKDAILTPLTSERARRFIKKRLLVWDDVDIYRACQCGKNQEDTTKPRKKKNLKVTTKSNESDDTAEETWQLRTDSSKKKK